MANLHKSKSDFDHHRRCKRHPKHRQSPGVCSLCLTEKLSQIILSATTSSRKISDSLSSSSSSCSSSYYSSASSCSSCSSPNPYAKADFVLSASSIFKKSRSMAFAQGTESESGNKSNLGFWSRFLSWPRRKGMELEKLLMRSTTVVVQRNVVHG